MALGLSFAFDANKETPQDAQRRRAIAEAIMGRTMSPQNVGEGFGAIAQGIVANVQNQRAGAAEQAGRAGADSTRAQLASMLSGGAMPANANGLGAIAGATGGGGGMDAYRNAIASIESAGSGDYAAVGPTHPKLGRALGKYQVMEANIGPWSKQVLGREVTPDEFMASPEIQDAIFDGIFGGYVDRFGPEGAAQAWFAGPGGVGKMDRKDSLGTTVSSYTDKFNSALGLPSQQPTQVASLDPGILRDIPATAGNIDPGILRTPPDGVQNIDPGILRPIPDTPAQNPASGLFDPGLAMGNAQPQQVAQAGNLPMQPQAPQPRQAPGSDVPIEFLMEALSSPWVDDATKAVASQLLQQQLAPPPGPIKVGDVLVDPNTGQPIYDARNPSVTNVNGTVIDNRTGQPIYQAPQQRPYEVINGEVVYLDPQAGTAESAGTFGAPEPGWRGLSPEEKAAYGIPADSPAQINTATGEVKGLGGVNVTTNVGGSPSNFFQSLGEAEVENYTTMLQQGPVAARTLNQIDQLESLLANTPQGFGAAATAFAGNFGIDLGDASGVQAATALINQMVPAQRPPGSGPMSDADLELFKQSVPRLINQPGGNELIIQTMRDMAQYDLALSRIIQEHTWLAESARSPEEQSEIRRQMRDQIDALQNPLENFNARIAPYRREGGTPEGGGQSQANPDILPAPDGVPADLWGVMTPEERALWQ